MSARRIFVLVLACVGMTLPANAQITLQFPSKSTKAEPDQFCYYSQTKQERICVPRLGIPEGGIVVPGDGCGGSSECGGNNRQLPRTIRDFYRTLRIDPGAPDKAGTIQFPDLGRPNAESLTKSQIEALKQTLPNLSAQQLEALQNSAPQ